MNFQETMHGGEANVTTSWWLDLSDDQAEQMVTDLTEALRQVREFRAVRESSPRSQVRGRLIQSA